MIRRLRLIAGLTVVLAAYAQTVHAQWYYPEGYGGFGWGGWGGGAGSTVLGSAALGLGVFAQGAGQYNLQTAQANAINADTLGRWNEYLYESQQIRNQKYYQQLAAKKKLLNASRDAIYQRLRDNPDDSDITSGDALNVILDQLTEPKVFKTALRLAKSHVESPMIKQIPFQYASEAITTSLHEMTSEEDWPLVLKGQSFATERKAFREAMKTALAQDDEGDLTPETIDSVRAAVRALWNKAEATIDQGKTRLDAERHIKALAGMARMLESPALDKIIAGVDKYKGTTVADLLSFMHSFNVRFGAANTPAQRKVYRDLYPIMDSQRDEVLRQVGSIASAAGTSGRRRAAPAGEFFNRMDWEHLDPSMKPPAAKDQEKNDDKE
jgi:hypothetical protein